MLSRAGWRGGREHFKQTRASVDGGLRLERVHRAADNTRKMIFRLTVRTSLPPGHSHLGVDSWGLFGRGKLAGARGAAGVGGRRHVFEIVETKQSQTTYVGSAGCFFGLRKAACALRCQVRENPTHATNPGKTPDGGARAQAQPLRQCSSRAVRSGV